MHIVPHTTSGRRDVDPYRFCGVFIVSVTDGGAICNRNSLGSSRTSTPTIDKDRRRMFGGDRYDLGRPVVAPTDEIEILTLTTNQTKNSMSLFTIKKKHAVGCPSACFYIAIELNKRSGMLLGFTVAQTPLENIYSSYVCTL